MAEGNGEEENPYSFHNYSRRSGGKSGEESDDAEESVVKPDLGLGNSPNFEKKPVVENHGSGSEVPKREENPFSFKHFLKRDTGNTYSSTGARPKVYSNLTNETFGNLMPESSESDAGLYSRSTTPRHVGTPELTSVLPDFVQDHLVVEQCYLNHSESSNAPQLAVDLENLPDFTINSSNSVCEINDNKNQRQWNEPKRTQSEVLPSDIPFDLTGTTTNQNLSRHVRNGMDTVPLDLPNYHRNPVDGGRENNDGTGPSSMSGTRNGLQIGEVGVSKSLPDFLSDGPIHSATGANKSISGPQSPDPLRITRRQLADQTRRAQSLEKELFTVRSKEHEETSSLEKAVEQAEDNLKRTTRRAVSAENTVSKLKQELKLAMSELSSLRHENRELRCGRVGASASFEPSTEVQSQRLAQELRIAASTAEQSLRQLLTGVGNLRVIASTLENMHRIQDRTGDFLADLDDDDDAGPAL
ncbi:hypothetical protein L9F63_007209 [Diploptera punctata]|uniref:Endosome-associated-trafficking regulator 1 n=1 Tax=Diploptera punctata TaxID=6984 RepID=A0AAD7Z961_DIPPU|nr:hypothetical protein L9F63_007209 [Diploptera punctata]